MEGNSEPITPSELGPLSYDNWLRYEAGDNSGETLEYPLFTDAHLIGEVSFGPYQVINAIAGSEHEGRYPAAYLRIGFASEWPQIDLSVTNDERHHGGSLENEIAALLSLTHGCRMYAGPATRWFRPGDDPKGRPWSFSDHHRAQPQLMQNRRRGSVVPHALGERNLTNVSSIARFNRLSPRDAVAVIRVARLFQDALWIAESQPEISWLLLVSAVEAAAGHREPDAQSPSERVTDWKPQLATDLINAGGPDLLARVADTIAPLAGATGKFIRFLLNRAPAPPESRPPTWAQIDWARSRRRELFSTIYNYRSRALHDGKPFPAPMCDAPYAVEGTFSETPTGLATGSYGAAWRVEDTPILLNTFTFIARQALLNWWSSLDVRAPDTPTTP